MPSGVYNVFSGIIKLKVSGVILEEKVYHNKVNRAAILGRWKQQMGHTEHYIHILPNDRKLLTKKLSIDDCEFIRQNCRRGSKTRGIGMMASLYGVNHETIDRVLRNTYFEPKTKKHVSNNRNHTPDF